jgi:uncharacterized protein (TIGR03000 family)
MLRNYILIPAVLALAGLLTSGSPVLAQHTHTRGPAHVSAAHANVSHGTVHAAHVNVNHGNFHTGVHVGGVWNGGYYNHNHYGGWYSPYYSWYNPYWYGGYSYPYANYYSAPSYSYYYNPMPAYVTPNYAGTALAANTATIEVIVPDPQARVWFDDTLTTQTGTDRVFTSAPLYTEGTYRIRAAWTEGGRTVTAERMVTVSPNARAVADFTRPAAY